MNFIFSTILLLLRRLEFLVKILKTEFSESVSCRVLNE